MRTSRYDPPAAIRNPGIRPRDWASISATAALLLLGGDCQETEIEARVVAWADECRMLYLECLGPRTPCPYWMHEATRSVAPSESAWRACRARIIDAIERAPEGDRAWLRQTLRPYHEDAIQDLREDAQSLHLACFLATADGFRQVVLEPESRRHSWHEEWFRGPGAVVTWNGEDSPDPAVQIEDWDPERHPRPDLLSRPHRHVLDLLSALRRTARGHPALLLGDPAQETIRARIPHALQPMAIGWLGGGLPVHPADPLLRPLTEIWLRRTAEGFDHGLEQRLDDGGVLLAIRFEGIGSKFPFRREAVRRYYPGTDELEMEYIQEFRPASPEKVERFGGVPDLTGRPVRDERLPGRLKEYRYSGRPESIEEVSRRAAARKEE